MSIRKIFSIVAAGLIAFGAIGLAGSVSAQDKKPGRTAEEMSKAKPTATFEVAAEQYSLIVGGSSGKGMLHYQGKSYPFTMKGGTAGSVGVTKVNAVGDVYFLNNIDDFAGDYSAVTAGATLVGGAAGGQYENGKGVILSVRAKTKGASLSVGLSTVRITLTK
jgi:hypothetical protein